MTEETFGRIENRHPSLLGQTESFLIYLISIQITLNLQINIDTSSQTRKVSGREEEEDEFCTLTD